VATKSAFSELVRRYHSTLVKVARYYVASAASAEDVAQDTWIAVLKGIEKFEGRSTFKTWLLRICVNRARTSGVKEHRSIPVDPNESGPTVSAHRFDQAASGVTAGSLHRGHRHATRQHRGPQCGA